MAGFVFDAEEAAEAGDVAEEGKAALDFGEAFASKATEDERGAVGDFDAGGDLADGEDGLLVLGADLEGGAAADLGIPGSLRQLLQKRGNCAGLYAGSGHQITGR